MALTAQQLTLVKLDIPAARLGLSGDDYDTYLKGLVTQANGRESATDTQRLAEVRYYLLGWWIRNYGTGAEALKSASGSSITKGKGDGLAALQAEQARWLAASGLAGSGRSSATSGSVEVVSVF